MSAETPPVPRPTRPSIVSPIPRRDPTDPPPAADIAAALVRIEGTLDMLVDGGQKTNLRLTRVEERLDEQDGRLIGTNARVRQPSEHDLAAQAQLAQERTAREELSAKVEALTVSQAKQTAMIAENTAATLAIKNAVVGVVTNKKLVIIGKALFVIAAGYLAGHGTGVLP